MRAAVTASVILALGALVASTILWTALRHTQSEVGPSELRDQKAQIVALEDRVAALSQQAKKVRALSVSTADTVLLQHKTIGLVVDSQKSLLQVAKQVVRDRYPAPVAQATPTRRLYAAP